MTTGDEDSIKRDIRQLWAVLCLTMAVVICVMMFFSIEITKLNKRLEAVDAPVGCQK